MNNKIQVITELTFLFIALTVFVVMLPGLAVSVGSSLSIYLDGLNALSPLALKAGCASVGMIFVTYLTCLFFKAHKEFMVMPVKLTCISLIILPVSKGTLNFLSGSTAGDLSDPSNQEGFLHGIKIINSSAVTFLMQVIPVIFCYFSIITLAIGVIILLKERYRGKGYMHDEK